MSEENKNENEEQDDFFGDDDDFGLPDLDFEALDDDDDSPLDEEISDEEIAASLEEDDDTPAEEPVVDETLESEASAEEAGGDDNEEGGDVFSEDFGDFGDDMDDLDISDEDLDISDEDLPDDIDDDILGDQSFEDFEAGNEDLDEEVPDSVFDSDILDDDEFKDFEAELEQTENEFSSDTTSTFGTEDKSGSKGKFTRIVVLGTILFAVLGFGSWYAYNNWFDGDSEEVADATPKKTTPPKRTTPKQTRPQQSEAQKAGDAKQGAGTTATKTNETERSEPSRPATTTAIEATPGTVTRLQGRTGNTFIIVGSFVDEDMAVDFANKLAASGGSPSIIPPFGGRRYYYRVAIASFPTIASAQQNIDRYRSEYGQDTWALKY